MPIPTDEAAMLLAFRVSNFKSIRDEAELLLTRSKRLMRGEVVETPIAGVYPNPVTAIYGANASGKSNVLAAIAFLSSAVRKSFADWKPDREIPVWPFLLDESSKGKPSAFEVDFAIDGVRYQYGFEADSTRIRTEWLYAYPLGHQQIWFERDHGEGGDRFRFGGLLKGPKQAVADLTRATALFLSTAAHTGHEQLAPVARWLGHHLRLENARDWGHRLNDTLQSIRENDAVKNRVVQLLRAADLGIHGIEIEAHSMPDEQRERLARALRLLMSETEDPDSDEDSEDERLASVLDGHLLDVQLLHAGEGGRLFGLPFDAESGGTRALVALAAPVLDALERGHLLLVDEIETSLHPDIVRELVRLFQDPTVNTRGAQLVFTTHDTDLLDTGRGDEAVLERDQFWITVKDRQGGTSLEPVSDFKLRKSDNLRRNYVQGRLGGIPVIDAEQFRGAGEWGDLVKGEQEAAALP